MQEKEKEKEEIETLIDFSQYAVARQEFFCPRIFQRVVTHKELSEALANGKNKLYRHNSAKRNTSLTKEGAIVVLDMFWGQYDAVTYNRDTDDRHFLLVLEIPQSRIIEYGKGTYLDYDVREMVEVDEFLITGYKPNEIKAIYDIAGLYFHDVYRDSKYGRPENIKLERQDVL